MPDLYVHHGKQQLISVKSASISSGVAPTTALRWLKALECEGLIVSEEDPDDHRRRLIRLSEVGIESMTKRLEGFAI